MCLNVVKMKNKLALLCVLIIFIIIISMFFMIPKTTSTLHLMPIEAIDSDANPSSDIIQRIVWENDFEDVTLKERPFGYIIIKEWDDGLSDLSNAEKAIVNVQWKTDVNRGASNIYIGYSTNDGETFEEVGPFNETEIIQNTKIELPKPFVYNLKKVQVRWRGEDIDYRLAARGYVNFIMDVYV